MNFRVFKPNSLVVNFLSLSSIQFVNLVLPLITIPFLTQKLGISNYGLVSYIFAIMLYIVSIVDFGFNYSATKEVSIYRNDIKRLTEIFNSIQVIKLIFTLFIFIILIIVVRLTNFLNKDYDLLYLSYFIVVGQGLQSLYFFQGMEKMKFVSYFNLVSKVIYTLLIFLFVKESKDFKLVIFFYGLSSLIPLLLGYVIININFKVAFKFPKISIIRNQLINGWFLFISNVSINILMNANIIILAIFATLNNVGNFSVAEKILVLSRAGLVVILQSTYPHVCLLATQNQKNVLSFVRKVFLFILLLFTSAIPIIYWGAEIFSYFLTGSYNLQIANIIELMCIIPLIIGLNVPASQILLAFNHQKDYSFIMVIAAIANVALNFVLAPEFGVAGTIISIYVTESLITAGLYVLIWIKYPTLLFFNLTRIS